MQSNYSKKQFYNTTNRAVSCTARKFLCTATKEDLIEKYLHDKIIDTSTSSSSTPDISVQTKKSSTVVTSVLKTQDEPSKNLNNDKKLINNEIDKKLFPRRSIKKIKEIKCEDNGQSTYSQDIIKTLNINDFRQIYENDHG